eukprot:2933161-Rhodomonas_salina.2
MPRGVHSQWLESDADIDATPAQNLHRVPSSETKDFVPGIKQNCFDAHMLFEARLSEVSRLFASRTAAS